MTFGARPHCLERILRSDFRSHIGNEGGQVPKPERLGQNSLDAEFLQSSASLPSPCGHNDGAHTLRTFRIRLKPARDVLTIHPRHRQIKQHHVVTPDGQRGRRLNTVLDGLSQMAGTLDHSYQHIAQVFAVVNDQEAQLPHDDSAVRERGVRQ